MEVDHLLATYKPEKLHACHEDTTAQITGSSHDRRLDISWLLLCLNKARQKSWCHRDIYIQTVINMQAIGGSLGSDNL